MMMTALKLLALFGICLAAAVLDGMGKYPPGKKAGYAFEIMLIPHSAFMLYFLLKGLQMGTAGSIIGGIIAGIFLFCRLMRLSIRPYREKLNVKTRVKALYGGKVLLKSSAYSMVFQAALYIVLAVNGFFGLPEWIVVTDTSIAAFLVLSFALNGIIRVVICCYRLNIIKRITVILLLPIPLVNIFVLVYMYKKADEEYDYEVTKAACGEQRVESQICATKYPILLVHGIGFRDRRYFNYWGRVPKELIKNGARVYYGMQEACVTVEYSGEQIKQRIEEIIRETGCEKVNIIAHSKGGLDARYAVSTLGMADYVATVTTVGSPHRGSPVADEAQKLSDSLYHKVAAVMDKSFNKFGDTNSDFYNACHEFTSEYAERFNKENPDSDKVYYQSYASVMKNCFSFGILFFTYNIVRKYGENDGLVTVESAKWGNFRKVYRPERIRGISHGDTIDLKREDFKGFDPREMYVSIVSELKSMGY